MASCSSFAIGYLPLRASLRERRPAGAQATRPHVRLIVARYHNLTVAG
jgi:hypothetical protein